MTVSCVVVVVTVSCAVSCSIPRLTDTVMHDVDYGRRRVFSSVCVVLGYVYVCVVVVVTVSCGYACVRGMFFSLATYLEQ